MSAEPKVVIFKVEKHVIEGEELKRFEAMFFPLFEEGLDYHAVQSLLGYAWDSWRGVKGKMHQKAVRAHSIVEPQRKDGEMTDMEAKQMEKKLGAPELVAMTPRAKRLYERFREGSQDDIGDGKPR